MADSRLQHELHKKNPFDAPEQEVALNLARTADQLQHEFARLFKERGLTEPQYNVLRILRGSETELPCLTIAARMISQVPDITRLVDRLEGAKLVERRRTEADRRVVLVRITDAGLKVLADLDGPVLELHRRQLGHLSDEEMAELSRLLVKARSPVP